MTAVKYASFGIIIDDIVYPDGRTQMGVLGGGGPQTAWGMALAAEEPGMVGLVSGVGPDFDPALLAPLRTAGIDLSGVRTTHLPTPRAWELLEWDEHRTHIWRTRPSAYDVQIGLDWKLLSDVYPHIEAAHWYVHPERPNLSLSPPLRERGALISIETSKHADIQPPDETIRSILNQCDVFSPNWEEAVSLFGTADGLEMCRRAAALGGRILALRCAADGAEVWNLEIGKGVKVPAAPCHVVDPVGAGNTFCGAFIVTLHRTGDLMEAAIWASVAASYMVEQVGLPPELPSRDDVERRRRAVHENAHWLAV
jgi:sugar/nucleoside kinase (ribokinase family)